MIRVLFVCMGNICRSPTAQGVFEQLVREEGLDDAIHVDSAGTHAYHVGEPPDPRAQSAAAARAVDLSGQRARKVSATDLQSFHYVLAMDQDNLTILRGLGGGSPGARLSLFMDFAPRQAAREVPDPYYGGSGGFEHVLDLVEEAARGLLDDIRRRHLPG